MADIIFSERGNPASASLKIPSWRYSVLSVSRCVAILNKGTSATVGAGNEYHTCDFFEYLRDKMKKKGLENIKWDETIELKDAAGVPYRMTQIDGKLFPPFGNHQKKQVRDTQIRPDDVILCGYPKTGCHWVWETVTMILKGKGENSASGKGEAFIEMISPGAAEATPSPRILNTHYAYNDLPSQALAAKTKLILTIRNPKDTLVSFYNHMFNLKIMMEYGKFLNYYQDWQKAIEEHPDHPVLVLHYEDLKEDFPTGIRRLADFIGVTLTEEQVQEIAHAGDIKQMKEHFKNLATASLFRKGQVGDWKNWLTVVQNEEMDEKWGKPLRESMFNIRYQI